VTSSSSNALSSQRILITGGAGFIGTALARRLVERNQVVIYDSGHRNGLKGTRLSSHKNLKVHWGDVMDAAGVRKAMAGCNMVVHLAAIAGVDTVLKMPVKTMEIAIIGTYNVLQAAMKEKRIRRVIDFSTSEVFGTYAFNVREGDVTRLGAVGEARWTYAVSKLATEHLAHNYHKEHGLPVLSVRPFNIYGPGQIGEGAIRSFVLRALKNEDLEVHNDGSQIRAWCYIDDIVDAILLCLEKPEAVGQAFNIGNPRSVCTIYNLARQIIAIGGSRSSLVSVPWNSADVELRIPNIDKARRLLGFEPKVDLEEGLARTIDWYRKQKKR
jgi:nucleoside-diphosphate-sugar epimerase